MSFDLCYVKDLNGYRMEKWKTLSFDQIFSRKYHKYAIVERRRYGFSEYKTVFSVSFLLPLKNEDGIILNYQITESNSYDIEKEAVKKFDDFIKSLLVRMGGIQLMMEKQIIEKPEIFIKKFDYEDKAEAYIVKEISRNHNMISYLVCYFPYGSDYDFAFTRRICVDLGVDYLEFISFFREQARQDMENYIQGILKSYEFAGHLLGMGRFVE